MSKAPFEEIKLQKKIHTTTDSPTNAKNRVIITKETYHEKPKNTLFQYFKPVDSLKRKESSCKSKTPSNTHNKSQQYLFPSQILTHTKNTAKYCQNFKHDNVKKFSKLLIVEKMKVKNISNSSGFIPFFKSEGHIRFFIVIQMD